MVDEVAVTDCKAFEEMVRPIAKSDPPKEILDEAAPADADAALVAGDCGCSCSCSSASPRMSDSDGDLFVCVFVGAGDCFVVGEGKLLCSDITCCCCCLQSVLSRVGVLWPAATGMRSTDDAMSLGDFCSAAAVESASLSLNRDSDCDCDCGSDWCLRFAMICSCSAVYGGGLGGWASPPDTTVDDVCVCVCVCANLSSAANAADLTMPLL